MRHLIRLLRHWVSDWRGSCTRVVDGHLSGVEQVLSGLFCFIVGFGVVSLVRRGFIPLAAQVVRPRDRNTPTIETATKTYLRVVPIGFVPLTGIVAAGYDRILSESAVIIAALSFALGIAGHRARLP